VLPADATAISMIPKGGMSMPATIPSTPTPSAATTPATPATYKYNNPNYMTKYVYLFCCNPFPFSCSLFFVSSSSISS
jgi:hypothetical protein